MDDASRTQLRPAALKAAIFAATMSLCEICLPLLKEFLLCLSQNVPGSGGQRTCGVNLTGDRFEMT